MRQRLAEALALETGRLSDLMPLARAISPNAAATKAGVAILEHRFEIAGDASSVFR